MLLDILEMLLDILSRISAVFDRCSDGHCPTEARANCRQICPTSRSWQPELIDSLSDPPQVLGDSAATGEHAVRHRSTAGRPLCPVQPTPSADNAATPTIEANPVATPSNNGRQLTRVKAAKRTLTQAKLMKKN
ncbi:hypothetical protein PCANC_28602 [Puccinia coronata f. sp. avenae]|uniref:Uncharacterized protein n=1 Tax=Puccinia coronata f. sp. avenae TaxID=200324 RepID=A0A2N5TB65_9BASI|nr:hypothetical protein PCANC_28602 [Puccinia coronata f. sp. avenae]